MQKISPATVFRTSAQRLKCFPVNIPRVLGTTFFIEQLQWLLLNYILVLKGLLKKKVIGEIPFDLISLFHVQIQEPKSRSTTTAAFVFLGNFAESYYRKIFGKKI